MRILISFVGLSDPIRFDHEGPILQIIRNYQPSKVYLLLTNYLNNPTTINNMKRGIFYLCPNFIEENIIFVKTNIDNPAIFSDFSLSPFINDIIKANKEAKFIYNMSSGTPQLLSALALDIVLNDRKGEFIQVVHPNPNEQEIIELSKDDIKNTYEHIGESKKRAIKTDIYSFKINKLKEELKSKTELMHYRSLYGLLETYKNTYFSNNKYLFDLIDYAYNVDIINTSYYSNTVKLKYFLKEKDPKFIIEKTIINYFLAWENEFNRGNFLNVMLRLTPLFYEILKYIFIEILRSNNIKTNIPPWNNLKKHNELRKSELENFNKQLGNLLNNEKNNVSSLLLIRLLEYYDEGQYNEKIQTIRKYEEKIRNELAHDIQNKIKNQDLKKSAEVVYTNLKDIIKDLFKDLSNSINYDFFKMINLEILKEINNIWKGGNNIE